MALRLGEQPPGENSADLLAQARPQMIWPTGRVPLGPPLPRAPVPMEPPTSPERRYLAVAAAVALALATVVAAMAVQPVPPVSGCAVPTPAPNPTGSPIRHIFFLIKENHALENYFGTLPGVDGYPPNGSLRTNFSGNATIAPYPLTGSSTGDLPHDRGSYVASVDGGRMDDFVAEAAADGYANANQAVGYYSEAQLPDYFAYARNYTLDDHFFVGVLGPTLPNRLFDLGLTNSTWPSNFPPPPSAMTGPTLLSQLASANLPWAYYYSGPSFGLAPMYLPAVLTDHCLAAQIQPISGLSAALHSPDPPAFAWIDPSNDMPVSEHPPANVTLGEEWTVAVLNEIFSSPIGGSSAVFLFYDEGGGFWDPLAPPTAPPLGDGSRVPLLVISPYTPKDWIDHQTLDPANLLHLVDQNLGLPPLNARVAAAPVPTGLLNLSLPSRLPAQRTTPVVLPGGADPPKFGAAAHELGLPVGARTGLLLARSGLNTGSGGAGPDSGRSRLSTAERTREVPLARRNASSQHQTPLPDTGPSGKWSAWTGARLERPLGSSGRGLEDPGAAQHGR